MTITFDSVLSGLAGLFLGLGGSLLTNRIALSGFDRLCTFLFVLGIALLPVSFYIALVRRISALEDAAKRTPHATHVTAASATAR